MGLGVHGISEEQKREIGRKTGRRTKELGIGIFGLSEEQRSEAGRKGGRRVVELGLGIWGFSEEQKIKNCKKGGIKAAESNMNVLYNGNCYHSASEAAVAHLFERYIPRWKVKRNETWQVRNRGIDNGGIDFLIPDCGFVEFHPPRAFYGKSKKNRGHGDFRNYGEYEKFKEIKGRIRECHGEDRAREFDKRIKRLIAQRYAESRRNSIDNSEYRRTPLVYCRNAEDVYDKVISTYGKNIPSKEDFSREFRRVLSKIKNNQKSTAETA
ncbi:MAG: hypothetical protein NT076_02040 [Candidatus Pacearchaeota archaeon]|nr:hypothetical protein [Candidatus Pacearchaeota archaeon]